MIRGTDGGGLRRLAIVDDSKAMRAYLRNILKTFGAEMLLFGSGAEALSALEGDPPLDLLIVDWNLPGMDGLTLVRRICGRPAYAGLRVLMVSTEVETARIREALGSGVQEYLMKPFTPEMLLEKLLLLGVEPSSGS